MLLLRSLDAKASKSIKYVLLRPQSKASFLPCHSIHPRYHHHWHTIINLEHFTVDHGAEDLGDVRADTLFSLILQVPLRILLAHVAIF